MKKILSWNISTAAIVLLFIALPVFASSYEWIPYLRINSFSGVSGSRIDLEWKVESSSNWNEYRSIYFATSSLFNTTTPSVWTECISCRKSGSVNTSTIDTTSTTVPYVNSTSTLWIRATTNYSGCGTWTPNPDTGSCGDIKMVTTTVRPF